MSITNTGGRDVVISKIAVRGQTCALATNVYTVVTSPLPTEDLTYVPVADLANATFVAAPAAGLTLKSGATMLVYIRSPDSITVNDVGLTVAISVFTAQATYYKETNINAVS